MKTPVLESLFKKVADYQKENSVQVFSWELW